MKNTLITMLALFIVSAFRLFKALSRPALTWLSWHLAGVLVGGLILWLSL